MKDEILLKYKKVIARLLEIACEQFSNHVCENFDLEGILPDVESRRELAKLITIRNDPEDYDSDGNYNTMQESQLMLFFASILNE